jgi:hypothetical protein
VNPHHEVKETDDLIRHLLWVMPPNAFLRIMSPLFILQNGLAMRDAQGANFQALVLIARVQCQELPGGEGRRTSRVA